jgi:hypothetical protein
MNLEFVKIFLPDILSFNKALKNRDSKAFKLADNLSKIIEEDKKLLKRLAD